MRLVTRAMELAMVDPANRDHELVAHSASECTRLCKGEMMRIRRHAAAHQARLPQHELPVILIAQANRFCPKHRLRPARLLLGAGHRAFWRGPASEPGHLLRPGQHEPARSGHTKRSGTGVRPSETSAVPRRCRSRRVSPETAPRPFSRLQLSACSWQGDSDAPRPPPRPPSL